MPWSGKVYETTVTEVIQEHVFLNFEYAPDLVKIKWTHVYDAALKKTQGGFGVGFVIIVTGQLNQSGHLKIKGTIIFKIKFSDAYFFFFKFYFCYM